MSFLLAVFFATAQQLELPPPPRGYGTSAAEVVVDAAGVLDPAVIDRLNRIAFDVHAKTGGEMAIVTMPDLRGRDVADVALRIGREWGVGGSANPGDRRRNAGVVILLVPKETASDGQGRIRIETGRGAEGFVTDAIAGDIRRAATPFFQQRDYGGGLLLITSALADRYAREFGVTLDTSLVPSPSPRLREPVAQPVPRAPSFGAFLFLLFVVLLIVSGLRRSGRSGRGGGSGCLNLLWAISVAQSQGRRGGWGGGGFGGGSFGGGGGFGGFGGGGGFSGGGSSGSW